MKRWLLGIVLSLAAAGAMAQTIVDVDFVNQAAARGALRWDVRDEGAFARGHIPGAVNIGDPTLTLRDAQTEDYLPTADIEKRLGAAGQLVATTVVKLKAVALKPAPQPGVLVTSKEAVAALKRPDVQFLDVRTVKEFRGEDVRAIRGGHIPAAINVPFEQNWIDPDTRSKLRAGTVKDSAGMALKPRAELAKVYEKLDPAREIIVYCQSGNRAAQSAAVLVDLGYRNVKVYDSSWLGYSSWLSAPAEDEVWTNFGSLPATIRGLENRFGELERAAAKK